MGCTISRTPTRPATNLCLIDPLLPAYRFTFIEPVLRPFAPFVDRYPQGGPAQHAAGSHGRRSVMSQTCDRDDRAAAHSGLTAIGLAYVTRIVNWPEAVAFALSTTCTTTVYWPASVGAPIN